MPTKSLLIVDDDEVFCQILQRSMIKRAYDTEVAFSQKQAIDVAQHNKPDLAIVDLCIAQDSGLNVIKALLSINPKMRIVVLTGYASISTAIESIKLGAIHYLTKPAEINDIINAFYHDEGNVEAKVEAKPMSAKRLEWEHLQKVLSDNDGNISAAARAMNMHRRTLQRKLQKKPVKD